MKVHHAQRRRSDRLTKQFGKTLLAQQLPEYSAYYINYKALKKVIKSLAAGSENETLLDETGRRQTRLQANKATFFFKLERELDKVNAFYLQKEAELRNRLDTLVEKRKLLQAGNEVELRLSATFIVLQEGFQQFERDLNKLQQYVELNATGFYKALKKWDKRSKSHTKELYLSRRVEIQPVFNRDVLSNLVDTATSVLLELEAFANGDEELIFEQTSSSPNFRAITIRAEDDLDSDILKAVVSGSIEAVTEITSRMTFASSTNAAARLTRIFMQAMTDASEASLQVLVSTGLIDFSYQNEISGRLCIHEAVLSLRRQPIQLCLLAASDLSKTDVYGRTPLHYACMQLDQGNSIVGLLLENSAPVNVLDHNISSPLHYAIMNGNLASVELLLKYGADVNPTCETDYIPLSMACARGNLDIATLLLNRNARILYNTEGLLPIHLVARAGHKGLCRLLFKHNVDLEARDKFSGWTPIFFAASEGHVDVLNELIDCGAMIDVRDDDHHSPTYYAAWEGHKAAVQVLLDAGGFFGNTESSLKRTALIQGESLYKEVEQVDAEEDGIPSLLLPPPIIPVRSYGHNYLDKTTFLQISLTNSSKPESVTKASPVQWYLDESLFSSSKLTVSLKSTRRRHNSELIPHTVSLPIIDNSESFSFQVDSLDHLCLEFEIYPTFGSKVIAKGVAPPNFFNEFATGRANGTYVVPLLDPRLQSIGQVSFEFTIIRPFSGVQFDIHSRIETYWKSTQAIAGNKVKTQNVASGLTPPIHSQQQQQQLQAQRQHLVTESSLSGEYVWTPIQVTRDNIAFVASTWGVPSSLISLTAAELDSSEFEQICSVSKSKKSTIEALGKAASSQEVQTLVENSYIRLSEFLEALDVRHRLHLQILLPTFSEQKYLGIRTTPDVNAITDTVLSTVFAHAEKLKARADLTATRSIFFSSGNSIMCTALNWKQPNYPVFLASNLGPRDGISNSTARTQTRSPHGMPIIDSDQKCASLKEAVKFSKLNNLLGLVIDAEVAVHAPALITTIKQSGLVLITHGVQNDNAENVETQTIHGVDGIQVSGLCRLLHGINT